LYAWRGHRQGLLPITIVRTVAFEQVSSTEATSVVFALPQADSVAVAIVEARPFKVAAQTGASGRLNRWCYLCIYNQSRMRTYTKALLTKASNMITLLLLPVTITRKRTTIAATDSVLRDGSIISWIDFVVLRRRMIMSEGFEPYIAYTEAGRHK
jgi:hypothetical protein